MKSASDALEHIDSREGEAGGEEVVRRRPTSHPIGNIFLSALMDRTAARDPDEFVFLIYPGRRSHVAMLHRIVHLCACKYAHRQKRGVILCIGISVMAFCATRSITDIVC